MQIKIKICGLTSEGAIQTSAKLRVDMLGFSFYAQSPRNTSPEYVAEMIQTIPQSIQKVAVFVDPAVREIQQVFEHFTPEYIQLDGNEPVSFIQEIKKKFNARIIKSIEVSSVDSLKAFDYYAPEADYILFDGAKDGNHIDLPETKFDWGMLKHRNFSKSWILSGGLDRFNVLHAIRSSGAVFVNASATLEETPGIKSSKLIEEFVKVIQTPSYL